MRSQKHSSQAAKAEVAQPDRERGFSLIEIMVAIPIMAVVSLGTLSLFTYAMRYNAGGNSRALAIGVAQQQLEQLRSVAYSDSSLTATADTKRTVVAEKHEFTVDTTITDLKEDSSQPTVVTGKQITINVTPLGGYDPTKATPSSAEQTTRASFSVTGLRAPADTGSYYSVP